MLKYLLTTAAFCLAANVTIQAQGTTPSPLAVTEVQTSQNGSTYPDWWELKNFGSNDIDLTGYAWNDDSHGGLSGGDTSPFTGVTIHAGETMIFSQSSTAVTTPAAFRTWWGIPSTVQVIIYPSGDPGLGAGGDTVRLWNTNGLINGVAVNDGGDYLVDRVDVFASPKGFSMQYNPTNGLYNITNKVGVLGAFTAASQGDVGSPGIASLTNSPVVIATNPVSGSAVAGLNISLTAYAYGQPRPRINWTANGVLLNPATINGSIVFTVTNDYSFSTLTLSNVSAANAGTYLAIATNYFQSITSAPANIQVFTNLMAPFFTVTPANTNLFAYPGQSISLSATAFGDPAPTFQWKFNGTNISGATSGTLPTFTVANSNSVGYPQAGLYTLVVSNSQGSTNTSVLLSVTPKPNLRITEVEATEAPTNGNHGDWWELSNLGNFAVDLKGYRFDDSSASFDAAYTITNDVIIAAGETIVLAEGQTPEQFRTWWGPTNLPNNLQIVEYETSGISFSSAGDSLELWNAAATDVNDTIDSVIFGANTNFTSFTIDPYTLNFLGTAPDGVSVLGVNGAFAAAVGGDIGSPGSFYTLPRFTANTHTSGGTSLTWVTQSNFVYDVQVSTNLTSWSTITSLTATGSGSLSYTDTTNRPQAFYRLNLHR